jgi:hypothetical protein
MSPKQVIAAQPFKPSHVVVMWAICWQRAPRERISWPSGPTGADNNCHLSFVNCPLICTCTRKWDLARNRPASATSSHQPPPPRKLLSITEKPTSTNSERGKASKPTSNSATNPKNPQPDIPKNKPFSIPPRDPKSPPPCPYPQARGRTNRLSRFNARPKPFVDFRLNQTGLARLAVSQPLW